MRDARVERDLISAPKDSYLSKLTNPRVVAAVRLLPESLNETVG